MRVHSFYDLKTGELIGRIFTSNIADPVSHAAALAANTPEGCGHIEGEHDHHTRRVDLASGEVVDRAPDLVAQKAEAQAARRGAILRQIAQLEASQHRAVREVTLGTSPTAIARLRELDEKIAELRARL